MTHNRKHRGTLPNRPLPAPGSAAPDGEAMSATFADTQLGDARPPISVEALQPLTEEYSGRWRVWRSATGEFACATLVLGVSWVRDEFGRRSAYNRTLVENSVEELGAALAVEDRNIQTMLRCGVLTEAKAGETRARQ